MWVHAWGQQDPVVLRLWAATRELSFRIGVWKLCSPGTKSQGGFGPGPGLQQHLPLLAPAVGHRAGGYGACCPATATWLLPISPAPLFLAEPLLGC